jgi:hypothetical protein
MQMVRKVGGSLLVAGAILMLAMPAMAGNGKAKAFRQGGGTGKGIQQRLRDKSCLQNVDNQADQLLTASKRSRSGDRDGTPDRDRRRDGSCQQAIELNEYNQILAADQLRIRDLIKLILQDGTCQEDLG